jgi:hypothetical protein
MKSGTHSLNVRSSAFISTAPSTATMPTWKKLTRAAEHWMNRTVAYFAGQGAPRIQERRDRTGALVFKVYDPISDRSYRFNSEAEVRIWLESRYSR